MPTSQAAPNITALNAVTALSNTADPLNPSVPNGIITACNVRQRSTALWKQHAPQLDVRLVVLPMSQHWIVHLWAKLPPHPQYHILFHVPPMECSPPTRLCHHCLTLHHRVPSLKSQSEMWAPPSTATVRFHAYNPSGILFYQINSVITDFLGVKMHGGLPWLIFDVGSGPAVVGSNSTRTFIDAPDGFDAVSVQNVGSTYIIVSWDLPTHSNGILINFSLYCNGALAGVLPLTVISYNTTGLLPFTFYMYITLSVGQVLQSRPQALHSSWNVVLGVISAAASLPRPYGGAYSHSPIPQLEQDAGMGHLFPPSPQTGNPGSITEIGCTLLSGSAEQDALTMKQSPLKT
eukprot:Em0001g3293a